MPKTSDIPRSGASEQPVKRVNPGALPNTPKTPDNVGIGRYVSNSQDDGKNRIVPEEQDKTAELPKLGKGHSTNDAFFAQTKSTSAVIPKNNSAAPQIGRQIPKQPSKHSGEEAYDDENSRRESLSHPRTSGRRSTQILASKRVSDLIDDDEDIRGHGNNRSNDSVVDDIISGLNNHNNLS